MIDFHVSENGAGEKAFLHIMYTCEVAKVVLSGVDSRHHLRENNGHQFLSFNIAYEWLKEDRFRSPTDQVGVAALHPSCRRACSPTPAAATPGSQGLARQPLR